MSTAATVSRGAAPARFIGIQEEFEHLPSFRVFVLTEEIEGHPRGSSVSGDSLERMGYELPIKVTQHPQGGYTHAELVTTVTGATARIYTGWWSTRKGALDALNVKVSV